MSTRRRMVSLVFLAVFGLVGYRLAGRERNQEEPPPPGRPPTMIQTTAARVMEFREAIVSDGTLQARFFASVAPTISGVIDAIPVREGMAVEKDATLLFQVDNERLRQTVAHAEQSLVIARSNLNERQATHAKSVADLAQARKDFARTKSLYEESVVPLSQYEVDETSVRQLEALLAVTEAQIAVAEQNITLAEIALRIAEKDFRDSMAYAPISGVVSGRYGEPGEMASPGKELVRVDDTYHLKAVVYLPGQFYPRVKTGESVARVTVSGKVLGDFPVTYKAPTIDSSLRTFEVWADLSGDGHYAVPGAQCIVEIVLVQRQGIGVPRDAVQYRDATPWIFVPDGEAAKMVGVQTGLETDGWTELFEPPVAAGDPVITQGQFLLEDGYPIRLRGQR